MKPSAPKLIEANTLMVKRMGFGTVVHCDLAGAHGVARLRGDHDSPGQTIMDLSLPTAAWYLFSADASGRRVFSGSQ